MNPNEENSQKVKKGNKWLVPVGVSRTHAHLTQEHVEGLFGEGHRLSVLRELGQTGQFAAKETINVIGPKGVLQKVRIIGPVRLKTQIEVSRTDTFTVGIDAPIRDSGSVEGSPGAVLMGPKGIVILEEGCIIARAHIHMVAKAAEKLELNDGDKVTVLVKGEKSVCFNEVKVRLGDEGLTEFHIDTDEGNAAFVETGDLAMIKHKEFVIRDDFGNIINVEADNITFVQGKVPSDYYSQEGTRLLRTVFDYPASIQQEVFRKMQNPEAMEPNKYYLFTAVEEEKVIGIACFYWMPGINIAYIEHIGIIPAFQKRGIGSFFFNKVISFIEKNHPELESALLEVRLNREDLDNRKQFFLNLGSIPVETSFYPPTIKLDQEIMLMFKPLTNDARLTTATMEMVLHTLGKIL